MFFFSARHRADVSAHYAYIIHVAYTRTVCTHHTRSPGQLEWFRPASTLPPTSNVLMNGSDIAVHAGLMSWAAHWILTENYSTLTPFLLQRQYRQEI